MSQPPALQLGEQTAGAFMPQNLSEVTLRPRRVEEAQVLHGKCQVHVVNVLDGQDVDFAPHLTRPEDGSAGPNRLGDVLVLQVNEILLRQLLHRLQIVLVDEADGHQVGRVIELPKGEEFVFQVTIRRAVEVQSHPRAGGEPAEGVLFVGRGPFHLIRPPHVVEAVLLVFALHDFQLGLHADFAEKGPLEKRHETGQRRLEIQTRHVEVEIRVFGGRERVRTSATFA